MNAQKLVEDYKVRTDKWSDQLKEEEAKAHEFEAEFRSAERKGNRYDLGEVILEIGLVITSIYAADTAACLLVSRHGVRDCWLGRVHHRVGVMTGPR